jgi:hypothetical protein
MQEFSIGVLEATQFSAGGADWRGPAGRCWRAAVRAAPGRDQTGQRRKISLALDTARIGWQTLLQAAAREQASGLGAVGRAG